jgi:uncharacterized protein YuzE
MYLKYCENKTFSTEIENDLIMDLDNNWKIVWIEIIWINNILKESWLKIENKKDFNQ